MPIARAAEPAGPANIFKIDFPIKPGESSIDVKYTMPYSSPAAFEGKILFKGGPTSIIAPQGVQLKGQGIEFRSQEPRTKASIYQTTADAFKIQIEGTGVLKREEAAEPESGGPKMEFVLPKLYDRLYWVLALSFSILLLGFVLLYRAGRAAAPPQPAAGFKKK
jgi:hypothetical protein